MDIKEMKRRGAKELYLDTVNGDAKNGYVDTRTELHEGVYKVNPIGFNKIQLFIVCPFCKKIHVHGLCGGKYQGPRTADCKEGREAKGKYYELI